MLKQSDEMEDKAFESIPINTASSEMSNYLLPRRVQSTYYEDIGKVGNIRTWFVEKAFKESIVVKSLTSLHFIHEKDTLLFNLFDHLYLVLEITEHFMENARQEPNALKPLDQGPLGIGYDSNLSIS